MIIIPERSRIACDVTDDVKKGVFENVTSEPKGFGLKSVFMIINCLLDENQGEFTGKYLEGSKCIVSILNNNIVGGLWYPKHLWGQNNRTVVPRQRCIKGNLGFALADLHVWN